MTREVILDTETTGMDPDKGDRLVEIGCLELINHVPTGKTFQTYLNPERDVPADAVRVHGLTTEFLRDKPVFTEKVDAFLEFIGDATLVIHNAEFDMKFINAELKAAGFKPIPMARVLDTLLLAREKFPGQPASLDALCRRFKIDNTERTLHGALLDSELLADVYMEMIGGRQHGLGLVDDDDDMLSQNLHSRIKRQKRPLREFPPTADELKAHENFLGRLKNPLWKKQARE